MEEVFLLVRRVLWVLGDGHSVLSGCLDSQSSNTDCKALTACLRTQYGIDSDNWKDVLTWLPKQVV